VSSLGVYVAAALKLPTRFGVVGIPSSLCASASTPSTISDFVTPIFSFAEVENVTIHQSIPALNSKFHTEFQFGIPFLGVLPAAKRLPGL
jgi:hypothetical protein